MQIVKSGYDGMGLGWICNFVFLYEGCDRIRSRQRTVEDI